MNGHQFGEQPEVHGTPGNRTYGQHRAFTASYEFTEFSLAVTTKHGDFLEVEVSLLGDQPGSGFLSFPIYREAHPHPMPGRDPGPEYVLELERNVMQKFASRLERLLATTEVDG